MQRTLKQLAFGSAFFLTLLLIAGGIYFFILKPAPSCTDNRQNQKEVGTDCGGPCIPCELKNLNLITEEVKIFPAGDDLVTFLAKVRNPSQNLVASFSYQFEIDNTFFSQSQGRKGKADIAPETYKYIVVPALPLETKNIKDIHLSITELSWQEKLAFSPDIELTKQTLVDKNKVTVTGTLSNKSAVNLRTINLTALLFDKQGKILNASLARLEDIPSFSQKSFIIFFPEEEGLAQNLNPQKTEIQLDFNE